MTRLAGLDCLKSRDLSKWGGVSVWWSLLRGVADEVKPLACFQQEFEYRGDDANCKMFVFDYFFLNCFENCHETYLASWIVLLSLNYY